MKQTKKENHKNDVRQNHFVRQNWNRTDQSDSSFCLTKFMQVLGRLQVAEDRKAKKGEKKNRSRRRRRRRRIRRRKKNKYGSTYPLYPPVPPTSVLKIEMETLTRTETTNMSNQSTPYFNIEEWGRGG